MSFLARAVLASCLGLVLCALAGSPTLAQSTIRVLVYDQPITSYDIRQRVRLMQVGGQRASEQAAIEELIDEAVQLREAQRMNFRVSDSEVDNAFATIARQVNMSAAQLTQELRKEGIAADSLKRRLRAQLTWPRLVRARMAHEARVGEQDIAAALLASGDVSSMTMTEYTLQEIVFVVPRGSSSGVVTQRRREAEAFRSRFQGCDQSLEQARQLRDVVVRSIGRRDSSELGGALGEEIQRTQPGQTTRPNQTERGIELTAVCSAREIRSTAAARAEVENRLTLEQAEDLGKDYLEELRAKAIIVRR